MDVHRTNVSNRVAASRRHFVLRELLDSLHRFTDGHGIVLAVDIWIDRQLILIALQPTECLVLVKTSSIEREFMGEAVLYIDASENWGRENSSGARGHHQQQTWMIFHDRSSTATVVEFAGPQVC